MVHREALVAEDLQQLYPRTLHAAVFANHDGSVRFGPCWKLLDANGDGQLSAAEKNAARIVIYGHSWGASETVTLARRLGELGIPVLLTIQVDSVEKTNEDDGSIPPNVRAAVNFYQTHGMVHGRSSIAAMDPGAHDYPGQLRVELPRASDLVRRLSLVRADVHAVAHRDRKRSLGVDTGRSADSGRRFVEG